MSTTGTDTAVPLADDVDPPTPQRARPALLQLGVLLIGSIAFTLLTYGSAIFKRYARLDDFSYVYYARNGELSVLGNIWLDGGRPLPALISTRLLPAIESVENLAALRLFGALSLAVAAAVLAWAVVLITPRRSTLELVLGISVAAVSLTTTAAPSAVTWAIMAGQLPAFVMAAAGGLAIAVGRRWWHVIGAALMIAGAAFSYQPTTPVAFFVASFVVAVLWAQGRSVSWWRPIFAGALVVGAMAADYAFALERGGAVLDRLGGATLSQRTDWFVGEFVPRTVDLTVPWSMGGAAVSALIAAVMLLMPLTLGLRYLALPTAVLISWACACLVIFPGELWASHRLISGAQLVFWVGAAGCAAIAISGIAAKHRAPGLMLLTLALVGVGLQGVVAHHRANDYFADPNVTDWQAMQCTMQQARPFAKAPAVELNDWGESTSPVLSYDEYGSLASATPWAIAFALWVALDSVDGAGSPRLDVSKIRIVPVGQPASPSTLVIDPELCPRPAG